MTVTSAFSVFSVESFPTIREGDSITALILSVLDEQDRHLLDGDIVVVASKIVSISEKRYVDLATVTPSPPQSLRPSSADRNTSLALHFVVGVSQSVTCLVQP
ncbi:MAG: coenzyme F420-0:L-glutamate ligase [Pseudonocardiaceae bacterium]